MLRMEVPGSASTALGLLAVLGLVLANAYFVATEFALVAVRRSEVKLWVAQGRRGAQAVASAIERLDDAIAATQLGITARSEERRVGKECRYRWCTCKSEK